MDVLDELIRKQPSGSLGARPVREFAELRNDIEMIKARQAAKRAEQMITDLAAMKRHDPDEYQRLAAELRKVLEEDSRD
jgi:adenine C2-methylase RlmN of 23S rRNA A2503 and tRNA A37